MNDCRTNALKLVRPASAHEGGMPMRLGFSINPATMYRAGEFYDAGIRETEISLFDTRESVEAAMQKGGEVYDAVTSAGIAVWSTHLPTGNIWDICSDDEEARKRNVNHQNFIIRAAASWGTKIVVVHGIGSPSEDESEQQKCIDQCRKSLDEMSVFASRFGIRVTVENMCRTPLENRYKILQLMDSCAGLCFDVNHLLLQNHDEFLDVLEKYVITVHLSDYDRGGQYGERHWKPGEKGGLVPWEVLCKRLIRAGYRGPWMFETDMVQYPYTVQEVVDGFLTKSRLRQ